MKFIREQKNLKGKTVFLRTDFDDPHDGSKLLEDHRIRMSLQTIEFLRKNGAKIIIASKTGRPKSGFGEISAKESSGMQLSATAQFGSARSGSAEKSTPDQSESMLPAAKHVADILKMKLAVYEDHLPNYDVVGHLIFFTGDIRQPKHLQALKDSAPKDIVILENMRFYPEEEACDPQFAKTLANVADIYVNDSFAVDHRSETTVSLMPHYLPAFAGLNLEKELNALNKILSLKQHPFVLIMGGAKISDKIETIKHLGKLADKILIGGGPANLFFFAKGLEVGKSLFEKEKVELAKELLRNFKDKIVLPLDVLAANPDFSNPKVCDANAVKKDQTIFDIGPKTILEFSKHIKVARKMVWNGPLGFYEHKIFSHGTMSIAEIYASRCRGQAFGIIGGGDTLSAMSQAKVLDQIDFASTGGGAMLAYLAEEKLPGIEALNTLVKVRN
jgi:phosphoglycerate kinase